MTISVEAHPDRTPSRASTLSPYFRFTATTRPANQQRFTRGIHSPASFPLFWTSDHYAKEVSRWQKDVPLTRRSTGEVLERAKAMVR